MHQIFTKLEILAAARASTSHTAQTCIKLRAEYIANGRNGNPTAYDLLTAKKLLRNFETENRKKIRNFETRPKAKFLIKKNV